MIKISRILIATLLAVAGIPVLAHHSFTPFDATKEVGVKGVVKELQIINPHVQLTLAVTDAQGMRDFTFESGPANSLYRAGFRRDMLHVGDTVSVRFRPLRDGTDGGYVFEVVTANGQVVPGFGTLAPQPPAATTSPRN